MKTYTSILLLSLLSLVNCSTKETKQAEEKSVSTTSKQAKEEQIFDLDGKIFWEGNEASIKIIDEEKPKVLFTNFEGKDEYPFKRIKLVNNKIGYLVSGNIKTFGDLNNDGIPEFIIDNITTETDSYYGFRMLINIANNSIKKINYAAMNDVKLKCSSIIGKDISFEFDSLSKNGPYLIEIIKYGDLGSEENCDSYEQAILKTYYIMPTHPTLYYLLLVETNSCPIESNSVNLTTLYKLKSSLFGDPIGLGRYFFNEVITPNLNPCGEDENMGIGHLEKLSGIRLEGGNAKKRTDLMPAIEEEFLNVNPTFITWARENLIPEPDKKQDNGLSYNYIFNKARTDFRSYALVRLLIEQENKEFLLREYSEAKATINNKSPNRETPESESNLIFDRSDWANEQLEKRSLGDIEDFTIYGFWMRRMLDGSEPEIWETLKYILKMYDGEWYANTSLTGLKQIDSVTFQNQKLAQNGVKILNEKSIPKGIISYNDETLTIKTRNGETLTYEGNSSESEPLSYSVIGYWAEKEVVIIDEEGVESYALMLIDINTGSRKFLGSSMDISKSGKVISVEMDDSEYMLMHIKLYKYEDNEFIELEKYTNHTIADGFWKDANFYFKEYSYNDKKNTFYKIGIGFDDIQPHTAPIQPNLIKTDSIPADSVGGE